MAIDINVTFDPIPDLPAEAYMALRGLKGDKGDKGYKGDQGESSDVQINGVSIVVDNVANIPLASTNADGAMSSDDKEKLDDIESGAEANVQSDWDEDDSTADSFIKNKPTLFSGDYDDLENKPSIPSATSDLTNDSGFITLSDIPAQSFIATYNSTSYADVLSAYNDGKPVYVRYNDIVFPLARYQNSQFTFTGFSGESKTRVFRCASSGWSMNANEATFVKTTLTINNKPLTDNVTLTASDVGAPTYTAGTGISITNGVISLDLSQAEGSNY